MKRIILLSLLSMIGYYWIVLFRFCHPYPKTEFFTVIWIQFGISFIFYTLSSKFGRIVVIICALTLVRLGPLIGMQSPIITLMGVFWGGVVGVLFQESLNFYRRKNFKKEIIENEKILDMNFHFILILFLIVLTFDRFLIYFNAPFFNGFGILETMYIPRISSKEAFALSMESISNLLFPLLYFYSESIREDEKNKIISDWKIGVIFGIVVQFFVMIIQVYFDQSIFAQNTNLSLEANRSMGLFRDSGSSSWILPMLCILLYEDFIRTKKYFYIFTLLFLQLILAPSQGRVFWLIYFLGLVSLLVMILKQKIQKVTHKVVLLGLFGIILIILVLYQIPRSPNSSFDRLLSIPTKLIFNSNGMSDSLLDIDASRYYFNLAAFKLFLIEPLFGNGIGSFIVNLKDSSLGLYTHENKIDNPSLILGTFSEIGLLGVIILILYLFECVKIKKNYLILFLLLPAFSIGYHIVHPDGGFAVLLILILAFGIDANKNFPLKKANFVALGIISIIFLHTIIKVYMQTKIPEFRQTKLNAYQLLAYEINKGTEPNVYHVFKGKTVWVLAGASSVEIDAFLDNSTSKKVLRQRWSVLDKSRNRLDDWEINISRGNPELNLFKIPVNGYYLQVEELSENGNAVNYGDVPFCLFKIHFSEKNEFY